MESPLHYGIIILFIIANFAKKVKIKYDFFIIMLLTTVIFRIFSKSIPFRMTQFQSGKKFTLMAVHYRNYIKINAPQLLYFYNDI